MNDLNVRKMEERDIKAVVELFKEVFNSDGENWSKETAKGHVKQNFFGDSHWVAEMNNQIVGFLMGIVLTREKGDELFVDSIVVKNSIQKKGVGKRLWEKAEEYVKERELKGIRLLANPHFSSFNWYKKMGYKKSGWIELYKEY